MAKIPGCRYGHTVCSYDGKIYMFGGRNDEDGSFAVVECYDVGQFKLFSTYVCYSINIIIIVL